MAVPLTDSYIKYWFCMMAADVRESVSEFWESELLILSNRTFAHELSVVS